MDYNLNPISGVFKTSEGTTPPDDSKVYKEYANWLTGRSNKPTMIVEDDVTVVTRLITVLAFRNRFKHEEKVAIELASTDPSTSPQTRYQAAVLRVFLKDLEVSTYVDLDRPDTISGVESLEKFGILKKGRAKEILNTKVSKIEIPKLVDLLF